MTNFFNQKSFINFCTMPIDKLLSINYDFKGFSQNSDFCYVEIIYY